MISLLKIRHLIKNMMQSFNWKFAKTSNDSLPNIWICYSRDDIHIIKKFTRTLANEGFYLEINKPVSSFTNADISDNFQKIDVANFFAAVISKTNLQSQTFKNFIQYATENKKKIIAIETGEVANFSDAYPDSSFVLHFGEQNAFKRDISLLAQKIDPLLTLDVFISYSREDKNFAIGINDALKKKKKNTWIDLHNISYSEEWWKAIESAIASAENFIYIISPSSVKSEYCNNELQLAIQYNKRIIPVLHDQVNDNDVPEHLRHIQWLPILTNDGFSEQIEKLFETVNADPKYIKSHTKYLIKAQEWINHNKERQYLLNGKQLRIAERWYRKSKLQALKPSFNEIQKAYIKSSQRIRFFKYCVIGLLLLAINILMLSLVDNTFFKISEYGTSNPYEGIIIYATFFTFCTVSWYAFLYYLKRKGGYIFNNFSISFPLVFIYFGLFLSMLNIAEQVSPYEDYKNFVVSIFIFCIAVVAYLFTPYLKRKKKYGQNRIVWVLVFLLTGISMLNIVVFGYSTVKEEALYEAIHNYDIASIKKYARDTSKLNSLKAIDAITHEYSYQFNYKITDTIQRKNAIETLINSGIPLNKFDSEGETLGHWIVMFHDTDMLNFLYKKGFDINVSNAIGGSLLMTAVKYYKVSLINRLIKLGININHKANDGRTALIIATSNESLNHVSSEDSLKNIIIIKTLVNYGADINLTDSAGNSALIEAVKWQSLEIINFLVKHGADVSHHNNKGYTPLYTVLNNYTDDPEIVDFLLSNSAMSTLNHQSKYGTLLLQAIMNNKKRSVAVLEKYGAKENTAIQNATENELNDYGYYLLKEGQLDKAIKIFNLNAEYHPQSANVWDSLGEGYAEKGDKKNAIINFKKVLKMNPSPKLKSHAEGYLEKFAVEG